MNMMYILLFCLILYFSFGAFVDAFFAAKPSNNLLAIKIIVIFHTYLAPLMFVSIILFSSPMNTIINSLFSICVIILGYFFRIYFYETNYLIAVHLTNDRVTIHYLTGCLKPDQNSFTLPTF